MEVLRTIHTVARILEGLRSVVKEEKELQRNLRTGLESIQSELGLLYAVVQDTWAETNQIWKPAEWVLQLQDLAYEIEDFIEMRGRDRKTFVPHRLLEVAMVTDPRPEHFKQIKDFQDRISKIQDIEKKWYAKRPTGQQITSAPPEEPLPHLVGMKQLKIDLETLLLTPGSYQNQLMVITILGRSGLGKTTLARALYEDTLVIKRFPHRATVAAPLSSDPNHVRATLQEILQQVDHEGAINLSGDKEKLKTSLQGFLHDKRYLVIIDGVHDDNVWNAISTALPENEKRSRVVVTTRNRSVAIKCSSGSFLFTMSGLRNTHQADLFWATYQHLDGGATKTEWLETFFAKSDGLPLVLVCAAEFLRRHGDGLNPVHCQNFGNALGKHIASGNACFGRMREAFAQCCDSVPEHAQKMCMLSMSSFPKGHVMNRNSLIRRWIAEGLVGKDVQQDEVEVACDCLDKLLDLGIVEPVPRDDISCNYEVKRCQVHGVMLELLVHRSLSWNFITLIKDGELVPNRATTCAARRLSVHGAGEIDLTAKEIDFSRIRSLTVCNNSDLITHLEICKLLRVLDLEGCSWFSNDHLAVICGLLHLKYVSLRSTQVTVLPGAIGNLHCLETLDVRQTKVDKLPMQALMLPQIAHLFGTFELPAELEDANSEELKKFRSQKSKLQTLAGFKIGNTRGFEEILGHAKKLKKLKISFDVPTTSTTSNTRTRTAAVPTTTARKGIMVSVKKLFKKKNNARDVVNLPNVSMSLPDILLASLETRFTGSNSLESLSIDLGCHCKKFLGSVLKEKCTVNSIKIRGEMEMLPHSTIITLTELRNIYELHLCNTGLLAESLSVLQRLHCLVSLRLEENSQGFGRGDFIVNAGGFPGLQRLCFDSPKLPNVEFVQDSMKSLLSLQLISLEPAYELGVTGITRLQSLREVILHSCAPPEKKEAWKLEANHHRNRPCVKMQQNSDVK